MCTLHTAVPVVQDHAHGNDIMFREVLGEEIQVLQLNPDKGKTVGLRQASIPPHLHDKTTATAPMNPA